MRKSLVLLFFISGLAPPGPGYSQQSPFPESSTGIVLSDPQWKAAVSQFQDSVMFLSNGLEKDQADLDLLQKKIERLENKIEELRQNSENGSNVFDEIRLKSLLNDLKDDLEKSSDLQHNRDNQQKEFEQKALSLIALYNDRIETELQPGSGSLEPAALQLKLDSLSLLIQKRNHIQLLLKKYQKKTCNTESIPIASLNSLKTNDREGLQLTQDLIQDRKKGLDEQLAKWSIEEEEVKNELKLQGKMQEFLAGIRRMNEDSDFPSGSLNKSDLGNATEGKERSKLEKHLNEIQSLIQNGQESLSQLDQLMVKIQNQLESFGERKSK
jgi:hypothetical protein